MGDEKEESLGGPLHKKDPASISSARVTGYPKGFMNMTKCCHFQKTCEDVPGAHIHSPGVTTAVFWFYSSLFVHKKINEYITANNLLVFMELQQGGLITNCCIRPTRRLLRMSWVSDVNNCFCENMKSRLLLTK